MVYLNYAMQSISTAKVQTLQPTLASTASRHNFTSSVIGCRLITTRREQFVDWPWLNLQPLLPFFPLTHVKRD